MRPGTALCSPCTFLTPPPPSLYSFSPLVTSPLFPILSTPPYALPPPLSPPLLSAALQHCPLLLFLPSVLFSCFSISPLTIYVFLLSSFIGSHSCSIFPTLHPSAIQFASHPFPIPNLSSSPLPPPSLSPLLTSYPDGTTL